MGAEPVLGRRSVVTGAAGLAAVGVLAGCGGGASSAPSSAAATPTATPAGPDTGVPSGLTPQPTVAAGGSAGTKLGPAAAVPVGGGVVYQDLEVVVTQPRAGGFEGLSAVCTHTGCIVDKVAEGLIECPCHGSRYHLDGSVARGPAPRPLTRRAVSVVDGTIVLT